MGAIVFAEDLIADNTAAAAAAQIRILVKQHAPTHVYNIYAKTGEEPRPIIVPPAPPQLTPRLRIHPRTPDTARGS